jgi:replicative DNA helicase
MKEKLQNLAIERAVLAGLCQYGSDVEVFSQLDFLETDYFTHEVNQILFSCVKEIVKQQQNIEYLTIFSTAEKLGVFDLINNKEEMAFIRSIFNFPIDKDNLPSHVTTLAKLKLARDIKITLKICSDKIEKISGHEEIEDIINIVEAPIMEITSSAYKEQNNNTVLIGDNIDEYVDYLIDNPSDYLGIPTGFPRLDEAMGGGLRRKSVTLIGARTGVGKSVISTNVAKYISEVYNIPALYLDTEMDLGDQRNRMLANISNVKINDIAKGTFARKLSDKEKVIKAAGLISKIPYHYNSIAGQPFDNVLNIIKRWIHQHVGFDENGRTKDCVVIYDYFKLMSSAGLSAAMQEYQALGFQITKMNDFCIKYDIPCLSFVQLNREEEIAQSDRLQWLASTVAKFQVKSDEELADDGPENGNRKFVIIKARHGSGLDQGDYINVKMDGSTARLTEGLTRNELKSGKTLQQTSPPFDIQETDGQSDLFDL